MESWRSSPDLVFHSQVWLSSSVTGRPTIDEGGHSVIMRDSAVEKRLPTLRSSTGSFESMLCARR